MVFLKKTISSVVINDLIEGEGQHAFKAFFHLAPGIKYRSYDQNCFELTSMDNVVANMCFFCPPKSCIEIFDEKDQEDRMRSLVARKTGVVEKTSLIMVRWEGDLPAQLITVVSAHKDTKVAFDEVTKNLRLSNTSTRCDLSQDDFIPVFSKS
jgi:hypothetical protein